MIADNQASDHDQLAHPRDYVSVSIKQTICVYQILAIVHPLYYRALSKLI